MKGLDVQPLCTLITLSRFCSKGNFPGTTWNVYSHNPDGAGLLVRAAQKMPRHIFSGVNMRGMQERNASLQEVAVRKKPERKYYAAATMARIPVSRNLPLWVARTQSIKLNGQFSLVRKDDSNSLIRKNEHFLLTTLESWTIFRYACIYLQ